MKLDSLIEAGTKDLGARFNLTNLMPSAFLALTLLALSFSGAPKQAPQWRLLLTKIESLSARDGILLTLALLVASLLTQPLQITLVRLLEGYWQTPLLPLIGRWLSWPGITWHRYKRQKLKNRTQIRKSNEPITAEQQSLIAVADWQLRRRYPATDRILPTAFGNALRAGEDRPKKWYGLDSVVIWPRLYPLLPDKMVAILNDQRNQVDLAARFCAVFCFLAPVSAGFLWRHGWWRLMPVAMVGLAWLGYRGAVAAAIAYGEGIQSAFDLYRFEIHKAFRLPPPEDLQKERLLNEALSDFLRQGLDKDLLAIKYDAPKPKKEEDGK